jgi:hypothetical protein
MKQLLCVLIALAGCKQPDPTKTDPAGSVATPTTPAGSAAAGSSTPAAPSVDPFELQQTTLVAHTTLSSVAVSTVKTAKELCAAGDTAVKAVAAMFSVPGIPVPPSIESEFRDELSGLLTNLGSFEDHYCAPGKMADLATIKDALNALKQRTHKLVVIASKAR